MPFVRLPNDNLTLHYVLKGVNGREEIDPTRPTLLLVHSLFLDAEWFDRQYADTRLRRRVNTIAFDQRSHGRTRATISPHYSPEVAAADIALALHLLEIPKCHVVCAGCSASTIGARLATMWPSKFQSFVFAGIPTEIEREPNIGSFKELADFWLMPTDKEEYLQSIGGSLYFLFGDGLTYDEQDRVANTIIGRYDPASACRAWEAFQPWTTRRSMPQELWDLFITKITIIQGEGDVMYPPHIPREEIKRFRKAKTTLEFVPKAPQHLFFTNATEFNTILLQHIFGDGEPEVAFAVPPLDLAHAFWAKSRITGNPSDASNPCLDPSIPEDERIHRAKALDFSAASEEQVETNKGNLAGLGGLEQVNANMFQFPNFWTDQEDKALGFRFSTRHTDLALNHRERGPRTHVTHPRISLSSEESPSEASTNSRPLPPSVVSAGTRNHEKPKKWGWGFRRR